MTQQNSRIIHYCRLMRLDKPIGSALLMWPTLWGVIMASGGHPSGKVLLIFIAGVIFMRSAGCVANDIADRNFDGHVSRTQHRPIVAGNVTVKEASFILVLLLVMAASLLLFLNHFTQCLALIALCLAMTYPLTKRFFKLPQLFLGLAFSWGIPMAFAEIQGQVPLIAWGLFLIAVVWPIAYDTLYAMADREDDLKIGVKSSAILFGKRDKLAVALMQLSILLGLILFGKTVNMSSIYYGLLVPVGGCFIYQSILVSKRESSHCLSAFLNNHWVGMFVLIAIYLGLK
jgi:4-hydroxybenzoate polyprenyltransferase